MFKPIQYTYNVINKTYSNVSLDDIVDGGSPSLISFDIEVGNNLNLPSFIKKYGNIESQFGIDDPENVAISKLSDQMLSSGDYIDGIEYPKTGTEISYFEYDNAETLSNSINEDNSIFNNSVDSVISPLNQAEYASEDISSNDLIGETYINPTINSEIDQIDQPLRIELNAMSQDSLSPLNSYLESNTFNNPLSKVIYGDSYSSLESIINNQSNVKDIMSLNDSKIFNSSINESTKYNSSSDVYSNIIDSNLTNLNPFVIPDTKYDINNSSDAINNILKNNSTVNDYKDSISSYNSDSSLKLLSEPGSIKNELMSKSYVKDIGVSKDVISIKDEKSIASNSSNQNNESTEYSNSGSSSNVSNTNTSNINNKDVKVTESSNINSDNSSNTESQTLSKSMRQGNIDITPLENRLKRIERILLGPLDVKIIE